MSEKAVPRFISQLKGTPLRSSTLPVVAAVITLQNLSGHPARGLCDLCHRPEREGALRDRSSDNDKSLTVKEAVL